MSDVTVLARDTCSACRFAGAGTHWIDPLRWEILGRIDATPGSRVAQVLPGDSIVAERALQGLVDQGWVFLRDDTVERPLAGPNVYLTPEGEMIVKTGRAWMRSIGTASRAGNRAAWRGLSAGRSPSSFDARELRIGTREEAKEHGVSKTVAQRIAMDHLVEDPRYYTHMRARENRADSDERYTAFWQDTGGTARMVYQGPSLARAQERARIAANQWRMPVAVVDARWSPIGTYEPDEEAASTIRDRAGGIPPSPWDVARAIETRTEKIATVRDDGPLGHTIFVYDGRDPDHVLAAVTLYRSGTYSVEGSLRESVRRAVESTGIRPLDPRAVFRKRNAS